MTTETPDTTGVQSKTKGGWTCPISEKPNSEVKKIFKECQEESFWYRALPLSLGSMAVTGGLIYKGIWKQSARFGPFPKLALAGIVGFIAGKASYMTTCQEKFHKLGPEFQKFGPPGFGRHSHCKHVCKECKKQEEAAAPSATPAQT